WSCRSRGSRQLHSSHMRPQPAHELNRDRSRACMARWNTTLHATSRVIRRKTPRDFSEGANKLRSALAQGFAPGVELNGDRILLAVRAILVYREPGNPRFGEFDSY